MKHTTKIRVLPLNESTCIQMFPVISGENIRCRLGIYLGHVSHRARFEKGATWIVSKITSNANGAIWFDCKVLTTNTSRKNPKKLHLLATA